VLHRGDVKPFCVTFWGQDQLPWDLLLDLCFPVPPFPAGVWASGDRGGCLGGTNSGRCDCSSPAMLSHAPLPPWASVSWDELLSSLLRDPSAVWGDEVGACGAAALQMEGTALGRARSLHLSQRWTLPGCTLGEHSMNFRWKGDTHREAKGLNRSEVLWIHATVPR
jgi:hypothetical protein